MPDRAAAQRGRVPSVAFAVATARTFPAHDDVERNLDAVGRSFYSLSTFLCAPTSRSQEVGDCLGAQAGERRLCDVAIRGGFRRFRRVAQTLCRSVFEARP